MGRVARRRSPAGPESLRHLIGKSVDAFKNWEAAVRLEISLATLRLTPPSRGHKWKEGPASVGAAKTFEVAKQIAS